MENFLKTFLKKYQIRKLKFFNQGPKNLWQDNLDKNIRFEIEDKFKSEMIELGYL